MVDFSFIGKEGVIAQYEDIISMIGYNVARYFKSKNFKNDKLCEMSTKDILLSYINRPDEDPSIWLKSMFDIEFNVELYKNSAVVWQPNWMYFYKVAKAAYDNGIKKIYVHTDKHVPMIENYITTFDVPVKYLTGDIKMVLQEHVNYTYLTTSPTNIKKCLEINTPIAITIFDDYMYLADIVASDTAEKLRKTDKFVSFSGLVSAGLI